MPFFYRGKSGTPRYISSRMARIATTTTLVAYPLGCFIQIAFPDTTPQGDFLPSEMVGMAFILIALMGVILIAPSYLQAIVGEESKKLDERELELRRKAHSFAYITFTGLIAAGALYLMIAHDTLDNERFQLWYPSDSDHWNAVIWLVLIYATVLPTAYLAWKMPPVIEDEEE